MASFSRRLGEEASSSSLAVSLSSRLAEKAEIQAIRASPIPIFSLREMEGYSWIWDTMWRKSLILSKYSSLFFFVTVINYFHFAARQPHILQVNILQIMVARGISLLA